MAAQITKLEIIEAIAQTKGWNASEIVNIDIKNKTFQKGKSVYMFALTPKKTMVKSNSIKFLWTVSDWNNCTYGA